MAMAMAEKMMSRNLKKRREKGGGTKYLKYLLILLVSVGLASLAIQIGYTNVVRGGSSNFAPFLLLEDADIMGREARAFAILDKQAGGSAKSRALAFDALRRDPTDSNSVWALILAADGSKTDRNTEALAGFAQLTTRRDVLGELWFAERYLSNGDMVKALTHIDVALRTSRTTVETLLPALVLQMDEPGFVEALDKILATKPRWGDAFIRAAAVGTTQTKSLVKLSLALNKQKFVIEPSSKSVILSRAVKDGFYKEAFLLSGRTFKNRGLVNGDFSHEPKTQPFDWEFISLPDIGAERQVDTSRSEARHLKLYGDNARGGMVAQQVLLLSGGQYRLTGAVRNVADDPQDRPYMSLYCASDLNKSVSDWDFPAADDDGTKFEYEFDVASNGCTAQILLISIKASKQINGTDAVLEKLSLEPLG